MRSRASGVARVEAVAASLSSIPAFLCVRSRYTHVQRRSRGSATLPRHADYAGKHFAGKAKLLRAAEVHERWTIQSIHIQETLRDRSLFNGQSPRMPQTLSRLKKLSPHSSV